MPCAIAWRVVSFPATTRSRNMLSSSCSVRRSPSISACTSLLTRSSAAARRRSAASWCAYWKSSSAAGLRNGSIRYSSLSGLSWRTSASSGIGVADHPVAPVDQPVGVLVGRTQETRQHADRELLRDLLDEVELPERQGPVEHRRRELAERELVGLDRPRRELRADEPAQARVPRRVGLEHRAARHLLLLVEVLEIRTVLGGEGLRVAGDGDDVGVLRHAPVALAERPVVPPDREPRAAGARTSRAGRARRNRRSRG